MPKLGALEPNQLSLFDPTLSAEEQVKLDAAHDEAVAAIRQHDPTTKAERHNRKLLEDLPVIEAVGESGQHRSDPIQTRHALER